MSREKKPFQRRTYLHKQAKSVPLGRTIEVNLYDLLRVRDVVPMAVRFPTIGDDLNQHASKGSFRDMRDSQLIGFDIDLKLFVLDGVLFDRFKVNAGVFDGLVRVPTCDFNRQARDGSCSLLFLLSRRLLAVLRKQEAGDNRKKEQNANDTGTRGTHGNIFHVLRKARKGQEGRRILE